MNVWLVMRVTWEGTNIVRVVTTREVALEYVTAFAAGDGVLMYPSSIWTDGRGDVTYYAVEHKVAENSARLDEDINLWVNRYA